MRRKAMSRLYRVIVPVPDMKQAVGFYRAVLGQPGESVVATRYYFNGGGVFLALVHPGEHQREFRPNPELVYFAEPDLEAAFARAQQAGAKPLDDDDVGWGIQRRPWGERS